MPLINPPVRASNILNLNDLKIDFAGAGSSGTIYPQNVFTAGREIQITSDVSADALVAQYAEAAFYISPLDVDCNDAIWGSQIYQRKSHEQGHKGSSGISGGTMDNVISETAKTIYLSPESFALQVYPNPSTNNMFVEREKSINLVIICNMYGAVVAEHNLNEAKEGRFDISGLMPGTYVFRIVYSDNSASYSQIIKQ